jgi:hypothetical protein
VTVTSENGVDTESFDVELQQAMISLRFDQSDAVTASTHDADDEATQVVLPIENFGYLDATGSVIVYLTHTASGEEWSTTLTIPARSTVNAVFSVGAMEAPSQRFEYRVEVAGSDANYTAENITSDDFSLEYNIQSDTSENNWMIFLIIAIIGLVVYAGVQMGKRGSGGKRF